ncbi:hypothetical protein B1C78_00545 [Thioalkalivibrio denitrificans]|uniref:MPN domain-containing protein n=1 Tax=Thioalkalivibrio denitrificans TaxID=108003 RepID=A0A1V3NVV5_9GAMM|nr:hypothetical protein B1C78_00545 [Thioalkalivibrio denitrificans]
MTKQVSIIELTDDEVIQYACQVLEERMRYRAADRNFGSPEDARSFLALKLGEREAEVFAVLFLDNRHNLLRYEEMFFGTIDGAAVYPREVVKAALRYNAAAVIFAHNHPSGIAEPSRSDEAITRRLREALALVEIRVLDHLVIGSETVSFAERGLL